MLSKKERKMILEITSNCLCPHCHEPLIKLVKVFAYDEVLFCPFCGGLITFTPKEEEDNG